jgi:hypothetical protein
MTVALAAMGMVCEIEMPKPSVEFKTEGILVSAIFGIVDF